jgi:hypothetical protein
MKKILNVLFLAMMLLPLSFISCDKDDKDTDDSVIKTITASVEDGNDYSIDVVKAFVGDGETIDYETDGVASSDYKNGGFTLNLPEIIANQYLKPWIEDEDDKEEIPDGIKISDVNAKVCYLSIVAYRSGIEVGEFYYEFLSEDETVEIESSFIYVDRDFSIKGSYSEEDEGEIFKYSYDVSLKKGWNILYFKSTASEKTKTYTYEVTAKVQGGLKWHFYKYYRYDND